jgi:hypothetical protein
MEEERRGDSRRLAYLGGKIIFPNKLSTANCIVRDVSSDGFRLSIPNSMTIPDTFELELPERHQRFNVRVTWRKLKEIGVTVVGEAAATVPDEEQRRLQKLERENAELKRRLANLDSLDP